MLSSERMEPHLSVDESGYHGTIDVTFHEDIALLRMNCGENRSNPSFYTKFHAALDRVVE